MVINLWFVVEKELTEIVELLQDCIGLEDLCRDYEDTWEWIVAINNISGIEFNISRKHDWNKGIYKYPVRVMVKKNNEEIKDELIDDLGFKISNCLKTKVFYGEVKYLYGNEFEFIEQKVYF
jgi:hypothetical protein